MVSPVGLSESLLRCGNLKTALALRQFASFRNVFQIFYSSTAVKFGGWIARLCSTCFHVSTKLILSLFFSVACQRWTQQANTNYANGQGNPAASVQLCQTACIANAACNGFDWVPTASAGQQCWLSGTWSGARGTSQGLSLIHI